MSLAPPADSVPSMTSTSVLTQDAQPSRKRPADDQNGVEVPFKQPRPTEPVSEAFSTAHSDGRQRKFSANPATDRSALQYQPYDGVRLSLDSGVHELSASSGAQSFSSAYNGFPPRTNGSDMAAASSNWTLDSTHEAARRSLDSGIQDLSGSSEHQNASSNVADVQTSRDASEQPATDVKHAQGITQNPDFKVLRALLVNAVPGEPITSEQRSRIALQSSADSLPAAKKRDGPYKVYSRLQTLNNVKRYDVSVDELRRRASLPEGFNAAILNSYLRRPKAAENVRELRSELSASGLAVPNGRRHHKNLTAFSCLMEQEAKDLANDYDDLSKTFPHQPFRHKLAQILQGPHQLASIQAAIQLLEGSLAAISDAVKSEPEDQSTKQAAKGAKKDSGLDDLSLVTHGFGLAAHRTAWTGLLQTLKAAALAVQQQQMSSRLPPMMPMPSMSGFAPPPWSMPPMSPFYSFMGYMPYGNH